MSRVALVVTLASVLLAASSATGQAQSHVLRTGFLDDVAFYNEGAAVDSAWMSRARAAGASLARINVYWSKIAPAERPADPTDPASPAYNWRLLDASVRNAYAHGLTPLLTVLRAPVWAEGANRDPDARAGSWRPDPGALADFARALARRYGGAFPDPLRPGSALPRVRFFQAWNEPNLYYYLTPQFAGGRPVAPALYRLLLNSFYAAVKSVQRGAVVLSAGLAPIGRRPWTTAPLRFMRKLTCMRGRGRIVPTCPSFARADIWATHPYTTGGPTHSSSGPDDVSLGDLPEMEALLRAAERHNRIRGMFRRAPLWITEFSWDTSPPDPKGVPMRLAGRWVAEALYRMWSAGASAVVWLTIRDGPPPKPGSTWRDTYQSGFYFYGPDPLEGRPKPSLKAFAFPFVALPEAGGVRVWGRTPTGGSGAVRVQARFGRAWRTVGILRADRGGIFERLLPRQRGRPSLRRRALRARFGPRLSVPFVARRTRDRFVRPFGG